jgi:hypothetical protein
MMVAVTMVAAMVVMMVMIVSLTAGCGSVNGGR